MSKKPNKKKEDQEEKKAKKPFSRREKRLLGGLIAVAIVAVVGTGAGFGLYFQSKVPSGAAAKIGDEYIAEEDVETYIEQYRASYSIEDDTSFATFLSAYSMSLSDFRKDAIDTLALNYIVDETAQEMGLEPTDEEVEEQLEATKEAYSLGDDDTWEETLETYGMTEDDLREQYRINLEQEAICEEMVEVPDEASDDELLAYMQSYLADTTQKHAYRIVFSGDDMDAQAEACMEEIEALEADGNLNTETFSELALEYSTEEGVEDTGGSYAWSGGSMSDTCKEALEYIDVGSCSEIESIDDEGTEEIYYCDSEYTFGSSDDLTEIPDDVPDELMDEIEASTIEILWDSDCEDYLYGLLEDASITYYPMPQNASYNIYNDSGDDDEDAEDNENTAEEVIEEVESQSEEEDTTATEEAATEEEATEESTDSGSSEE